MSIWSRTSPPKFAPHAVAGKDGWVHPLTGETLETFDTKPAVVTTPTINSVTRSESFNAKSGDPITSNTTHKYTNNTIKIVVQFNSQIVVTGQPYITVNFNGTPQRAYYKNKSGIDFGESVTGKTGGTSTLLFYYVIQSTDSATAGQVTLTSPIQLNGGTIKSYLNGNVATVTFGTPVGFTTLAVN